MRNKRVRAICETALLTAMFVVLDRVINAPTIAMGLKLGFAFLPIALCGILHGPLWCAAAYAVGDLLAAVLFPLGPYHPGFTISCFFMGLIYGFFLHRETDISFGGARASFSLSVKWDKIRYARNIILPTALICVLGIFVNSFWMSQLYGSKTYWGWVGYRALAEYAVVTALHLALLPLMLKLTAKLSKQ